MFVVARFIEYMLLVAGSPIFEEMLWKLNAKNVNVLWFVRPKSRFSGMPLYDGI